MRRHDASTKKSVGAAQSTSFFSLSQKRFILRFLATFGYVGLFPKFPGTMASFVTIFLIVLLQWFFSINHGYIVAVLFFVFSLILSIFVVDRAAKDVFQDSDPRQIVLDEVVGMSLTLVIVPFSFEFSSWVTYFVGFVSFRFFDVGKFFPVSFFDSRHKPFFVVLDDVAAAICSWPLVFLTHWLLQS